MKCSRCGSSLWDGVCCGACGNRYTSGDSEAIAPKVPPATPTPGVSAVLNKHREDIQRKLFYAYAVVTLICIGPSPVILTKLFGKPQAGLEEIITLWNILLFTLPLTIAVSVDAAIVFWLAQHPSDAPKTPGGQGVLFCVLGAVLIGSMLLGSWLGQIGLSEWSQKRLNEAQALYSSVDPSGKMTSYLSRGAIQNATRNPNAVKVAIPFVVAASAMAAIANYFTFYGPAMFFSSLAVGVFLGWLWAIKFPEMMADLEKTGKLVVEPLVTTANSESTFNTTTPAPPSRFSTATSHRLESNTSTAIPVLTGKPTASSNSVAPHTISPEIDPGQLEKWRRLYEIAGSQRRLIHILLAGLVLGLVGMVIFAESGATEFENVALVLLIVNLVLGLLWVCFIVSLSRALGVDPWIQGILTLVPIINLFTLFSLSQRATDLLRAEGIRVGFLGTELPEKVPIWFIQKQSVFEKESQTLPAQPKRKPISWLNKRTQDAVRLLLFSLMIGAALFAIIVFIAAVNGPEELAKICAIPMFAAFILAFVGAIALVFLLVVHMLVSIVQMLLPRSENLS